MLVHHLKQQYWFTSRSSNTGSPAEAAMLVHQQKQQYWFTSRST
jgi:hypothetical protein